jgi:hypothetical protein
MSRITAGIIPVLRHCLSGGPLPPDPCHDYVDPLLETAGIEELMRAEAEAR